MDTFASIYVNGALFAVTSDMHRTFCFDVKSYIHPGKNEIRIDFRSAIMYTLEQHEKEPYYETSDTVNGFSLVRKAHCNFGWDWGSKLPDIGIWRNVSLIAYEKAKLEDIYIHQTHKDRTVELGIDVAVGFLAENKTAELEIRVVDPDGTTVASLCEEAKEKMLCKLEVENPQLWWCHGFGSQPLYQVHFVLKSGDEVLQETSKRIGLRTLTVRTEKDE